MAKDKNTPSVGDSVQVRYLENPNAVEVDALGKVTAATGSSLDLEVARTGGRATLRLERVPLHDGPGRRAIPSWVHAPPAKA